MRGLMIAVLIAACGGDGSTMPDGGVLLDGAPDAAPGTVCEAFGEPCKSDPYPANTVCHDDKGWCINDVCRPQCSSSTKICSGLVLRWAPAGAGYCEPR